MRTGDCYNPVFKMDSFLFYVVYFSGVLILSIRLGDIDIWSVHIALVPSHTNQYIKNVIVSLHGFQIFSIFHIFPLLLML